MRVDILMTCIILESGAEGVLFRGRRLCSSQRHAFCIPLRAWCRVFFFLGSYSCPAFLPICFVVVAGDLELQNLLDILLVRIVFLQQCTLKHIQGGLFPVFVVANKSREWRCFVIQLDPLPTDRVRLYFSLVLLSSLVSGVRDQKGDCKTGRKKLGNTFERCTN